MLPETNQLIVNKSCIFKGEPNSETFDVTLMVALLRNMADLPEPTTGYDQLPSSTDKTPMADVARIKHYRNQLAHLKDGKIQSELFSTAWEDINGVKHCPLQ